MQTPLRKDLETPLRGVRTNIVQSIRAFRVQDLQDAATSMGHHFLYANLAHAQSKQDVLDLIAAQFTFPSQFALQRVPVNAGPGRTMPRNPAARSDVPGSLSSV